MTSAEEEKAKYEKAWAHDDYREYAPGEYIVEKYVVWCKPKRNRIIDFGAGTGRAALALYNLGFDVTLIDIADNCLDESVRDRLGRNLVIANLWDKIEVPRAEEGYCTDVMEHIPPEHVEAVIENILGLCDRVFFQICLKDDHFGQVLGEHLHLTVRSFAWWHDLLSKHGNIIYERDLASDGWYYVEPA